MERLIKTLDGSKLKFHPNCFFLSWTKSGPTPRYEATWCSYKEVQKKHNFSSSIKWKDLNMDIIIACDYIGEEYSVPVENIYQNIEYLKSHLQKSIRRSSPYKSLLTAWHFLDLSLEDFLRRLCIIALEDCLPIRGYSTLVWFMMAVSKGYKMSNEQICWVLAYVHDLAKLDHYEQIEIKKDIEIKTIKMRTLSQDGKNLVYSIVARKSYGGMRGDKNLCLSLAKLWSARYSTDSVFLKLLDRKHTFISPPTVQLQKSEWFLSAIDFHCCPNIIIAMWEKHDQYSNDEIRSAIWNCSSAITNKNLITEDWEQRVNKGKYLKIWNNIKKDFLSYSKYLLERNA